MTNGYRRIYPKHGTDRVTTPPAVPPAPPDTPPAEPSAQTMTLKLDELKAQTALIEKRLTERKEDTGVHKVHTDALEAALVAEYANAARVVWTRIRNWALGITATLAAGGGGFATWRANTEQPKIIEAADVQHTVEAEAKAHTDAIEANARGVADANEKIRRVTGIVIELGDEQAENTEYLGRKLDEINPKAKRVKPPPAFKRRKQKKEAARLDQRIDDVLGPKE